MPVDPQIQGMLDLLAGLNAPPLSSSGTAGSPRGIRADDGRHAGARDADSRREHARRHASPVRPGPCTPGSTVLTRTRATPCRPCCSSTAAASSSAASRPTTIRPARICRATRSVVVSLDYRLAPETKWPGAVEDSYAALEWAAEHIGELGGDPDHLADRRRQRGRQPRRRHRAARSRRGTRPCARSC